MSPVASARSPAPRLDPELGAVLAGLVALTLAPHVAYLPPWLVALCVLLLGWRVLTDRGRSPAAGRVALLIAALAVLAAVALEYRYILGKDPGLALLAGLACLKLLEARRPRDARALVLLCLFLQMGQFLNGQEIPVAGWTLAGGLLAVASLVVLESGEPLSRALRHGALLAAQAAPFMLALFVLFPRIPGPLWGLPRDAYSGMTGLSDTMRPGSISELIQSGEIAFRADFTGEVPPGRLRYWRGPVLSEFDGSAWRPGFMSLSSTPLYAPEGPAYAYRLTLEPHNQQWLLALDYPTAAPAGARYTGDFQLLSVAPVRARARHELRSHPESVVGLPESRHRLTRNLRLPERSNPRLQALGRKIAADHPAPAQRLDALIAAFRAQRLSYTLSPALLGRHAGDEFFFDSREGFCEHFSSAFTIAARAAGVPARVVTGYQGGELNPLDGSLVVRQSDAHAWSEVWLAERGWVRVDPTAQSHPQRIDQGIAGALPDSDVLPLFMQPGMAWLRALRVRWEALSNSWNQWILGYNDERQKQLLRRLGLERPDWRTMITTLSIAVGALMLGFLLWALAGGRRPDRLDRAWRTFCAKLARAGTPRAPWQGPLDFAREAATRHPAEQSEIREIARTYANLRYGPQAGSMRELRLLEDRVKRLRLR